MKEERRYNTNVEIKQQPTRKRIKRTIMNTMKKYGIKEIMMVVIQLLPVWLLFLVWILTGYKVDILLYASNMFVYVLVYCTSQIWESGSNLEKNNSNIHMKTLIYLILILFCVVSYVILVIQEMIDAYADANVRKGVCLAFSIIAIIALYATNFLCYYFEEKGEEECQ